MTRAADDTTVLGIDLGTGSVRAGLYSRSGALLAAREERVTTTHPRPGWAEQPPRDVLAGLYRAVEPGPGHDRRRVVLRSAGRRLAR